MHTSKSDRIKFQKKQKELEKEKQQRQKLKEQLSISSVDKNRPLLVCLAVIQNTDMSFMPDNKQYAFIIISNTRNAQIASLGSNIRKEYEKAGFHYQWNQKSEQGRSLLNYKHSVRVPNENYTLRLVRVYYDYRGPVDKLWGKEFATGKPIVHHLPKVKLYCQPLTNNKTSCPFCGRTLISTTVTVVFYVNSIQQMANKRYKYCTTCDMPYLSVCDKEQILADCAPFVQTFMVKDCKNLQEAKQKAMLQSDGKPFAEKASVQSSGATIQTYTPYKPVKIENNINLSLLPAKTNKIYVFAEKCYCRSCVKKYGLNTTESQTALVSTISGKTVPVNVQYCNRCGCYYMNVRTYKDYCNRYGHLLLEIHYTEEFTTGSYNSFRGFAKDSILSRCGYSVKQGIPATTRQKILIYIKESKRATKWQIIDLISGFISLNSSLPRMSGAVDRWSEDLTFVNNYKLGSQPLTSVDTFVQGGTISERYRSI